MGVASLGVHVMRYLLPVHLAFFTQLLLYLSNLLFTEASDVSLDIGSGAASQLLRQAAHQLLSSSRPLYLSFRTDEKPLLLPLAYIKTYNRISYSNVTVKFYPDTIRLKVSSIRIHSKSNITPNIWPVSFGDETVDLIVHVGDAELAVRIEEKNARMLSCSLRDTTLNATSSNYWMIGTLLYMATNPIRSHLQQLICPSISNYISNIENPIIMNISLNDILPEHIRDAINTADSSLFYRVTSISVEEKHILIVTQIKWKHSFENDEASYPNVTVKWDSEDRIIIWVDDTALNDFLNQVDWNFQWMEETIAVTSPVIPLSSREFLSTLCTSCYFLLNVWANGPPILTATNNTVVLDKRDRLNLRVVNPDKNVTSVFVSMFLAITAELRPVIDSGTLRTLVQLLDTNVVMESGAFPPSWSFFVQDLIKGMIIEMMWPEMRKQIEELTYSEGIRLAMSCGIDPQNTEILIGEGRLGFSTTLNLHSLELEQCLKDLKSALPNTAKLFPK
uniref:Fatty-acid and retinol-binding protein 1 n=1 Tax=Setaria digitata TaxID=48799 RepID=A0A915PS82_9BILA